MGEERKYDEALQLLVDSTSDYAIFALDPDGIVRTWNAGARKIKGYEAEDIVGRHFSTFYPQAAIDRQLPDHELKVATSTGVYEEEGWRLRKDGSQFWASVTITALRDSTGTLRGFGKVTRDLTERKLQDEALRQAEESFRLAFDAAPTGMALLSVEGEWLRVNDALCRTLQRTADELTTMTVSDVLGLTNTSYSKWFEPILGQATHRRDLRVTRPDGRPVWVQATAGLVHGTESRSQQVVLHIENVTARTLAALRLEEAEQAKSRFVALTSHELRTPLTSIRGFTELLERRWDSIADSKRREALDHIARQARRLQALVEDLLVLSTIDSEGPRISIESLQAAQVVREVARDHELVVDLTGDLDARVSADPLRLVQILSNLLSNSLKYGSPPYVVTIASNEAATTIAVRDHGDGVPESFVSTMFDMFTQADDGIDRRSVGTGLGLSISKALTEAHGGQLGYDAPPGGGARFTLRLPHQ